MASSSRVIVLTFASAHLRKAVSERATKANLDLDYYITTTVLTHVGVSRSKLGKYVSELTSRPRLKPNRTVHPRRIRYHVPNDRTLDKIKRYSSRSGIPVGTLCRLALLHSVPPGRKTPAFASKVPGPDATLYRQPRSSVRILAEKNGTNGWKGVIQADDECEPWAMPWELMDDWKALVPSLCTPSSERQLLLIASRINDGDVSYFTLPETTPKIYISARWNGDRFVRGEVIELEGQKRRQEWENTIGGSVMPLGPFSIFRPVRDAVGLLCSARKGA